MKFGETFTEYLHGDQEGYLDKFSHVEYKRLKKVLKSCRKTCKSSSLIKGSDDNQEHHHDGDDAAAALSQFFPCQSCPLCDQMFFSELMKEASDVAGCFSSRVRRLLHLHMDSGLQKYVARLCQCFKNDQQVMVQEGRILFEYVTMNALAIRKILKKYDKVHSSENGMRFKSKMRAEHIEILQSPWLIELGAFYTNFAESNGGKSNELFSPVNYDLNTTEATMTLRLSDLVKLEYDLTCPICLEIVFNPYALSCGHLFCKSCVCTAASVMIFQGPKTASPDSKCPVCREPGVYANAVHMIELDLLLKKRCKEYWRERLVGERAEMVKQSKEYWDLQAKYMIGY
ncbi:hypothetical protein ACH5RR_005729 [Cinchona calisaya]|uniref:RING-type E3 ubiquitin transferase n=1 Tax=Cinchona calisaya TaxID=153742 RepID=A0ABD3AM01_9GENT